MPAALTFSHEELDIAVRTLANAALKHGPEGIQAFERILEIQEQYEKQQAILEKARALVGARI